MAVAVVVVDLRCDPVVAVAAGFVVRHIDRDSNAQSERVVT